MAKYTYRSNDGATIAGFAILTVLLILVAVAIKVTAIVFAVINGFALFGPDGDITSVWHWVWFIICCLVVLSGLFSRSK